MSNATQRDLPKVHVVGIGASAGGLAAFKEFFSGMPAESDPNMAFVLVQHLAPDHKSMLVDLIQRSTRMQVFEIQDGMSIKPNCVYVIPPAQNLALIDGSLKLSALKDTLSHLSPIDFFFRSLAQDQHERAIGIVLSGSGKDGELGVRAIKGEGGTVLAQKPDSAEFSSMPESAIATGLVDFILPPKEMLTSLIAYVDHATSKQTIADNLVSQKDQNTITKILMLIREQTRHDFSQYKPSTIYRRIERRMAVSQIADIYSYFKILQQTPSEVEELFRDMLIGVTNFFRDSLAFLTLENMAVPKLFEGNEVIGTSRLAYKSIRVLVVDDESDIRSIILEMLNHLGLADIHEAKNGAEALDLIKREKFDLVFTDMKMPVMGGLEFINAVDSLGLQPKPHFYIVSGGDTESLEKEDQRKFLKSVDGFILKPFEEEDFALVLKTVLKNKKAAEN